MGFFTGISNKFISGQYRIILSADTASEVRQMPKQIILDVLSRILATQMLCRSCRSGA